MIQGYSYRNQVGACPQTNVSQAYLRPCGQPATRPHQEAHLSITLFPSPCSCSTEQALDRFDRHEEDVTTNNAIKKKENNWKTIRAG
jgi:hypothetical protein